MTTMVWHDEFSFTKGCPVMKINASLKEWWWEDFDTMLFVLEVEPKQGSPFADDAIENRMIE